MTTDPEKEPIHVNLKRLPLSEAEAAGVVSLVFQIHEREQREQHEKDAPTTTAINSPAA